MYKQKSPSTQWTNITITDGSTRSHTFDTGQPKTVFDVRLIAVNSLSLDFISASLAAAGEHSSFEEIGKRAVWTAERLVASASHSAYSAVAIDLDMSRAPKWMHGVLALLSSRAASRTVDSLPVHSFDMESQVLLAFRTLQSGLVMGKVVVRVARPEWKAVGAHLPLLEEKL